MAKSKSDEKKVAIKGYPSWRYHAQKEPVIVQNDKEDELLGEGWSESPATVGLEAQVVRDKLVFVPKKVTA